MKVAKLVESRRDNWRQLDELCAQMESSRRRRDPRMIVRFAGLYRSVCADLALAESYQLPPNTVAYLHKLVARAHSQLYRSRRFNFQWWKQELLYSVPPRLLADKTLWLAATLFWGMFIFSMILAAEFSLPGHAPPVPGYAERVLTEDVILQMEDSFAEPLGGRGIEVDLYMAGYYIFHNTGIGLKCFAAGMVFGVGGLFAVVFNAAFLGAAFGVMLRLYREGNPTGEHFFQFVTAHGPFELTAIVFSAAAGMRLGFSLIETNGLSRGESLYQAGKQAMPTMGAAIILFFLAAGIEGFISPSALPYGIKVLVAAISTAMLVFYIVMLGWPRQELAAGEGYRSPFEPASSSESLSPK